MGQVRVELRGQLRIVFLQLLEVALVLRQLGHWPVERGVIAQPLPVVE